MKLNPNQLKELAAIAADASLKAGALIKEYANQDIKVSFKDSGDSLASQVVTEVDERAQNVILKELDASIRKFDLALLTEESEDDGSRHEKDYFWCIDPIDGTLPFTRRQPGYAVSIGLVQANGKAAIGTVYDPVENCLYEAIKGQGIRLNGQAWSLSGRKPREVDCLRFFCDCTFEEDPEREEMTEKMLTFATSHGFRDGEVIIGGGAVLNACHVLMQSPAIYFKRPKPELGGGSFWDFAASSCLFTEAGASVTDFYGASLDLNSTTHRFFNHCGICFTTEASLVGPVAESFCV